MKDRVSELKELMAREYDDIVAGKTTSWDEYWRLNAELVGIVGKEWAELIRSQIIEEAE